MAENKGKSVALFVTCLVDLWRPEVARACEKLLKQAGFKAAVPKKQTCCGQVSYNSGDQKGARRLARRHIKIFAPIDYVVAPSGSCADMVKNHYPALFEDDPEMLEEALMVAAKTYELTVFLKHIAKWKPKRPARGEKIDIAYHDSCSCRRQLGIREEPRALLAAAGYEVAQLDSEERCCGFGGLFSVKYSDISTHLAEQKCAGIAKTGARTLAGADLGCLLNLEGRLKADGHDIAVRHIAEVLAGGPGK